MRGSRNVGVLREQAKNIIRRMGGGGGLVFPVRYTVALQLNENLALFADEDLEEEMEGVRRGGEDLRSTLSSWSRPPASRIKLEATRKVTDRSALYLFFNPRGFL